MNDKRGAMPEQRSTPPEPRQPRRSFLTRLGAGAAALGAAFGAKAASAASQTGSVGSDWQPDRHEQDDWFDRMPGGHRFILDNTTAGGFAAAMTYANNFFEVNRNDYGIESSDLAVVLVARHLSTPFAFNDAMWAKYGASWAGMSGFNDPRTNLPPTANLYNAGPIAGLGNRGLTLDSMFDNGMKIALCQVATRAFTGAAARAAGADPDAVYQEVVANLLSGVEPVPAGIVAINRAQERGYTFSFTA
jgi:hypothetical protein